MKKKYFTTTVNEKTQDDFRNKCKHNGLNMNEVLEGFMNSYINGDFSIKKETKVLISPIEYD